MRRLLVATALSLLFLAAGARDSNAAWYDTWVWLFHPTGSGTSATSVLQCGWHWNCDFDFDDSNPAGLDWTWNNGSLQSRFRITTYVWGLSQQQTIANASATFVPGNCPYTKVEIKRAYDNALIGTVKQSHVQGGFYNLSITGGGGYRNHDTLVGFFIDPDDDGCATHWHVYQRYASGAADYFWERNTVDFPTEAACNWGTDDFCPLYYVPFSKQEYLFKFNAWY